VQATVDYALTAEQIAFLLRSCRFRLLETAAHALARTLLAPPAPGERRAAVRDLMLRLTKPGALGGRAVPSLEIRRDAAWVTMAREAKPFGTVDVIFETKDAGVYRLNIAPGRGIPLHLHRVMQESEMVLGDGLFCQSAPCPTATVHRWPLGAAHRYDNPTDRWQTILCVDAPRFMEEDEVAADGAPSPVPAEPAFVAGARA
jgi:dihydroneopterin aldolase